VKGGQDTGRADASAGGSIEHGARITSRDIPIRREPALRAGDVVEVRSEDEILATLDERGTIDGLPFMPEMLKFCGSRFTVQSRAHKTCDSILSSGFRRMENAVHLAELRCDGGAHGGCQASCLLFWKQEWLKPVEQPSGRPASAQIEDPLSPAVSSRIPCTRVVLDRATRRGRADDGEELFSCQATELRAATSKLRWWDARQYAEDVKSRNVHVGRLIRGLCVLVFNKFQAANKRYVPRLALVRDARKYPFVAGILEGPTPKEVLDLNPGELVSIKSKEEIEKTLDRNNRNRGLSFDGEMAKYCGRTARVLGRVDKIIDERTGKMIHLSNECIMLAGVVCTGDYMQFCPRRIYSYWREIWLDRASGASAATPAGYAGGSTPIAQRSEPLSGRSRPEDTSERH
jgi:hypothetical protein